MAKQLFKRCLGVDIGTSSIKIAECSYERGTVRINTLLRTDLPAFPDAEAAELGTAKIIKDLIKANKITTREAVFCLSGQQVFSRRVRLPDASDERLARIVHYEARQQIPFPPEKTRIEYQVFRVPGEAEVEVLMVAARKDHIENFMHLADRTGLKPVSLSVSSVSLFNYIAFLLMPVVVEAPKPRLPMKKLFARKQKGEKKEGEPPVAEKEMELEGEAPAEEFVVEEAKALLNFGESHTDLIIARKAKTMTLAFQRSIPIAGREFTRFIQNAVGMETFAEADRIKREATRAFSSDQQIPDDPALDSAASAALSEIVDTRLSRQIQLSLDYFIAQPDGMAVDEIVIGGGSSRIEGLAQVLEDRLGVPVRRLEEPTTAAVLLNATPPTDMADFGIAIGEAMTGLGIGRVATNFLPERYKTSLDYPQMEIAVMAVLLGVMVFLSTQLGEKSIADRQKNSAAVESTLLDLRPQQQLITQAEDERTKLRGMIDAFLRAYDATDRDRLLRFYADLTTAMREASANTFLTRLEITAFGDILFEGKSLDSLAAPDIRNKMLTDLAGYLEPAHPPRLERNDRDANNVYTFEIRARLRGKVSRISTPTPEPSRPGTSGTTRSGPGVLRPRN